MGQDILKVFIDMDAEARLEIAKRDNEIDELTNELNAAKIKRMMDDPEIVFGATDYTLVGGSIERIGDYNQYR